MDHAVEIVIITSKMAKIGRATSATLIIPRKKCSIFSLL